MSTKWESKSERRFLKKVDRLVLRRSELIEKHKTSLEPRLGMLAIHVSTAVDQRSKNTDDEQRRIFQTEGEYLAEFYDRQGIYDTVKYVPKTNRMELGMDISDPEIAGIVTIGHGSLGDFWMPEGEGHFDWEDVASNARNRLKLGDIRQRTCGTVHKKSLPWGTFLAADQTRISAAIGESIPEEYPPDEIFIPVFNTPNNDREQLLAKMDAYLHEGSVNEG